MKYFKSYKGGFIRPIDNKHKWYWFPTESLKQTNMDVTPMLIHLISKSWFTEEMFLELIVFAKKKYPEIDYTMIIFEGSKKFTHNKIFTNKEYQKYILTMIDLFNGAEKQADELMEFLNKTK